MQALAKWMCVPVMATLDCGALQPASHAQPSSKVGTAQRALRLHCVEALGLGWGRWGSEGRTLTLGSLATLGSLGVSSLYVGTVKL